MPPKAIDKRSPLEGRDAIWAAIRQAKGFFTAQSIMGETCCSLYSVKDYMACLLASGHIGLFNDPDQPPAPASPLRHYLVKNVGIEAPRVRRDGTEVTQGAGRENMWRTMRILKEFSAKDLAIQASTETVKVAEGEAKTYVHYLHKAGYLVIVSPHRSGNRSMTGKLARYRLIISKFSGPKPPVIQRIKQVFDPNAGKVVWKGGTDDAE